nr:hypothetical protein BaRGS_017145 [Batillaria attramentaria]
MPTMNPDGWQKAYEELKKNGTVQWTTGRSNANNVDLNRNFPDLNDKMYAIEESGNGRNSHLLKLQKALEISKDIQPETRAVMKWLAEIGFVLSSNLHGGDLVANYPYDKTRSGDSRQYTASPDDQTFVYLAKSYSYFHAEMADPDRKPCDRMGGDVFNDGITNGGAWYSVGRESKLREIWEENAVALTNFMLQVTDIRKLLQDGDYYRLLADGDYEVTVTAKGYHPTKKCVTVENEMYVGSGIAKEAQVVDFVLTPDTESKPDGGEAAAECTLTEAEERQVLLEVLAYMDNRINWAKLGSTTGPVRPLLHSGHEAQASLTTERQTDRRTETGTKRSEKLLKVPKFNLKTFEDYRGLTEQTTLSKTVDIYGL